MTERAALILSLADVELVMFHNIGGTVPRTMLARLAKAMAGTPNELAPPERAPRPPEYPPAVVYPERFHRKKKTYRRLRPLRQAA